MNERYKGKRFTSFLVVVVVLLAAFFGGHPETFGSFSQAVAAAYGAYLAGQSATDYVKAKNGG